MQFQEEQDYTKRFDAGLWLKLLKYARPFYGHLAAIALTMLICAGMDVVFPLLTKEQQAILGTKYVPEFWGKHDDERDIVRFCTSWATNPENVEQLCHDIANML